MLVVGATTAVVATRLALSRYQSERWWDRKADSYAKTLQALFLVKRSSDEWLAAQEVGRQHTDEYSQQLEADWRAGSRAVAEAAAVGAFTMSPKALAALANYEAAQRRARNADDPFEQATIETDALDRAIADLTVAAQSDLGIRPSPADAKS